MMLNGVSGLLVPWRLLLAVFGFSVIYRPGRVQTFPNALSHLLHLRFLSEPVDDEITSFEDMALLTTRESARQTSKPPTLVKVPNHPPLEYSYDKLVEIEHLHSPPEQDDSPVNDPNTAHESGIVDTFTPPDIMADISRYTPVDLDEPLWDQQTDEFFQAALALQLSQQKSHFLKDTTAHFSRALLMNQC